MIHVFIFQTHLVLLILYFFTIYKLFTILSCICTLVLVKPLSRVQLFATTWTVAYQVPPSMGFSRQEHWSGFPFTSPRDLPNPGIEPRSPTLQADALPSEPPGRCNTLVLHPQHFY